MIDAFGLPLEHRAGTPPPTAERIGTVATPEGGTVVVAFGRGRVVLCWWARWPSLGQRQAFHRLHGFAPLARRRSTNRPRAEGGRGHGDASEPRSATRVG